MSSAPEHPAQNQPERASPAVAEGRDRGRQVELILRQVDELPTLSPIASRLVELGSSDEVEIDEVAVLIESDPALTARILKMCMRADRGLGDRITSVRQAIVLLGLPSVQSAVLSVCVYELMERAGRDLDTRLGEKATEESAFDRAGLWRHCVAVACASRFIAEKAKDTGVKPDEAFVGGLLHELGKMALELVLPRAYSRVVSLAERRSSDASPVEQAVLGLDHFVAGRRLAQRWGLPAGLVEVAWLHGQMPEALPEGSEVGLVSIVGAAKSLCRELHLGWCGEYGRFASSHERMAGLGITVEQADAIAAALPEEVATRCETLGIESEGGVEVMIESLTRANRRLSALNADLEARTRAAARSSDLLKRIEALHTDALDHSSGLIDTLGVVVRSARELMGDGFYAIICRSEPRAAWELHRLSPEGEHRGMTALARKAGDHLAAALDALGRRSAMAFGEGGLGTDLWAALAEDCETENLRAVPMPGADAVLLCEGEAPPHELVSAWMMTLRSGMEQELAVRLGEHLAEANRRAGEAQVRLADREAMARLGEMTAGAAHEMNNPLTVIRGRAQLLASRLVDSDDRGSAASIAASAAELSELITSLHVLTEARRPNPEVIEPAAVLAEAIDDARARAHGSSGVDLVLIESEDAEHAAAIEIDRELLRVIVVELVANAVESAGREGGASESEGTHANVQVRWGWTTDAGADGRLVVSVEDRGVGVSDRALRHAFDPFFSEKPAGRQRGLGLSKARRMAELMGGTVVLERRDGGGTVARASMPAAAADAPHTLGNAGEPGDTSTDGRAAA